MRIGASFSLLPACLAVVACGGKTIGSGVVPVDAGRSDGTMPGADAAYPDGGHLTDASVGEDAGGCTPGTTYPCPCPDGGSGVRTCSADGAGIGPCVACAFGEAGTGGLDSGPPVAACAHSPCVAGAALQDGCDDAGAGLVSFVCDLDDDVLCCDQQWSERCAMEASSYCSDSVNCTEVGCP